MSLIYNIVLDILENPKLFSLIIGTIIVFSIGISIGTMENNLDALRFIIPTDIVNQNGYSCCIFGQAIDHL